QVVSPVGIIPADQPVEEPVRFALTDQVETAVQNRLELAQQKLRIDSAETVVKAAKNNVLPKLNLVGSVGLGGLGNDFNEALRNQDNMDMITYAVGFEFEVPIGNRAARAIYQRTLLQRQQAVDQYLLLVDQV